MTKVVVLSCFVVDICGLVEEKTIKNHIKVKYLHFKFRGRGKIKIGGVKYVFGHTT